MTSPHRRGKGSEFSSAGGPNAERPEILVRGAPYSEYSIYILLFIYMYKKYIYCDKQKYIIVSLKKKKKIYM